MPYMTIGQMAKANQISEQTLRLYDKMGLFSPCKRDENNGYRYYDIRQNARLDMIQYLKSMGLSLKEIKKELTVGNAENIIAMLVHHRSTIDERIKELKLQRRTIDRTISSFEQYKDAPPDGTIVLEHMKRRSLYLVDTHINFYDYNLEMYEQMLRKLKNSLIEDDIPPMFFCNAGSIMREKHAKEGQFISSEVFVFIEDRTFTDKLNTVPSNIYMCIYCDNFSKEIEYAKRLFAHIEKQGMEICGDYICEVIADIPVTQSVDRGMFLRLQVPVKYL